jgi:protein involved in polysaccharide export with SLBB domain
MNRVRRIRRGACLLLVLLAAVACAAADAVGPAPSPGAAATTSWRNRYTLGPGDILNLALYGRPELDRNDVFIRPDGCIDYLQARNVPATGRTIDELRAALETELAETYRHVQVMISPVELRSKRYYIIGKVVDNGSFPMNHPITLIEAVARARGIETGLFEQNTVELADLPRSLLIRQGRRVPVDFARLFLQGDLTQNVELEPEDYLYFPSANTNEVFILGEVAQPGISGFNTNMTVVGAIALRGGFTKAAFRQRVLVVRGSLERPERFVIDTADVVAGRAPDFPLMPKDIVYVAARPWRYAEELLDTAVNTFLQSMTSSWTSEFVGPYISKPVLPQPK